MCLVIYLRSLPFAAALEMILSFLGLGKENATNVVIGVAFGSCAGIADEGAEIVRNRIPCCSFVGGGPWLPFEWIVQLLMK